MLQKWWSDQSASSSMELDTLLRGDRYARLKQMLQARDGDGQPRVEIKVVDRVAPLLHGKAGIITRADGSKSCFMGSVNETRDAWQDHYELLWEDESEEGIAWTQAEFDFLWAKAVDLPEAVIQEVERCADRVEIRIEDCPAWSLGGNTDLPRAALAESRSHGPGKAFNPGRSRSWPSSCVTGRSTGRRGFSSLTRWASGRPFPWRPARCSPP